jgi:CheY-like chemotaxis protein
MNGPFAGQRILVVEDEMLVLANIEMTLSDLGCSTFRAAASVSQAIALIAEYDFDMAILDVNLVGQKSYPVADALAERGIPFAFSTACGDHGDRKDLEDRPVLKKPYVRTSLEAVLSRLLAACA